MLLLAHFAQAKSLEAMRVTIAKQKYLLFSSEKLMEPPTTKCHELILNIMTLMIKQSPQIIQFFGKDIEDWIEAFGFC